MEPSADGDSFDDDESTGLHTHMPRFTTSDSLHVISRYAANVHYTIWSVQNTTWTWTFL
jgi:hypothetical protein